MMINRIIAAILTFAILIAGLPVKTVYAEESSTLDSPIDVIAAEIKHATEAMVEAKLDQASHVCAGSWYLAIYRDKLSWNYFHREVQLDVVAKNANITIEKKIRYKNENKEFTGEFGYADLFKEGEKDCYIWEVKPFSFSVKPNKTLGEQQLARYVATNPNYHPGNKSINGGSITRYFTVIHAGYTEYVKYVITYTVENNGLVIYHFERSLLRQEENKVKEEIPVTVSQPSKEEALSQLVNPGYVTDTANPGYTPDHGIRVPVATLMAMVAIASAWGYYHDTINSNPSTSNTVSQAISVECKKFIVKVGLASGAAGVAFIFDPTEANAQEINDAVADFELAMEVFGGDGIIDELAEALRAEDYEKLEEIIKEIQGESEAYDQAGKAQPPRDPLVIDLGEKGITLHSIRNGVNFDLDHNGFAEKTAWIGEEDGFLAYDRNGNGMIDHGGELFGDQVILSNGSKSASGFEALADMDENQDGVIDRNDAVFAELLVWIDANHNGISESGELKTLDELHIVSISLAHAEISFTDEETGARIAETSGVEIERGGTVLSTEISEFWFPINSSDTTHGSVVTAGNVPDINQAVARDESGRLAELCFLFGTADNIAEKRYYTKKILYYMTGAEYVAVGSRGGNIDARDLRVIEQFMGREFEGVGGDNPNANAAGILKEIYSNIEDQYYNLLNMYCGLGGYLKIAPVYENAEGNEVLNVSFLNYIFTSKINSGENLEVLVYDLGVYLNMYDKVHNTQLFDEYRRHYSSISENYAKIAELVKSGATYIGTDQSDYFGGTGRKDFIFGEDGSDTLCGAAADDIIYGKAGNDNISGGAGNDCLYGGEGDDIMDGGSGNDLMTDDGGNDTYVFSRGYGEDTIIDCGGSNQIRFDGLTPKDILVNGTGEYDVTIRIKGTSDSLVIRDFRRDETLADYMLVFQDQSMHCTDARSPFKHIYGSDGDDVLQAVVEGTIINAFGGDDTVTGSRGRDVIYGNSGNDRISAGEDDDVVYGGADDDYVSGDSGDDMLWGGTGNDVLDGGSGNDCLFGGEGDDTYLFASGYGRDIIEDAQGVSTVKLGGGLSMADISVYRVGDEAVIHINGTEDMLIVSDYGTVPENFWVETDDLRIWLGDVITDCGDAVLCDTFVTRGTEESDALFAESVKNLIAAGSQYDYIVGGSEEDVIFGDRDKDRILAGAGNDVICGGEGDDELFGDDGNDFICGGNGNDYMNGGAGDDRIVAGAGDDFIEDPSGNDTYYFQAGDGNNRIMDSDGTNTIIFGDDIFSGGIKAYRENWNDLLITFDGLTDTLVIKNYCIDEAARSFQLIFADGCAYAADSEDSALRNLYDRQETEYMPSIYPEKDTTITSSDGDDELVGGEGADKLIGGIGNNRIIGNGGDDILDGGAGKDYLCGGPGSDTYIYKRGYETDTISDSEGLNQIDISDYTSDDVKAYRTNWNDLTLVLDGSGEEGLYHDSVDKIVIEGFFTTEGCRNYSITFQGSKYDATAVNSPLRTIYGTGNDDYMQGFDDNVITMYGEAGNDTLNGGNASDRLYGGEGDDRLLGYAGNDILDGGTGNDYLEGGAGNDTYMFDRGYGTDTINDNQGVNTICFGEGIAREGITAYRTNWNDLTITFAGMEDQLVLQGYFTSAEHRKFDVKFADGRKYEYSDMENPINQVYASENDDWMNAWSEEGIFLNGAAGNDSLIGGAGNDVLIGGVGNDLLNGGAGDDVYRYSLGDGFDIITDVEGLNRIFFDDVTCTGVTLSYEKDGDEVKLLITVNDTDGEIVINSYLADNFIMEFSDGIAGKAVIDESAVSLVIESEGQESMV